MVMTAALVAAQRDEIVAAFTLAQALGRLTPASLGFTDTGEGAKDAPDDVIWKIQRPDVDIKEPEAQ